MRIHVFSFSARPGTALAAHTQSDPALVQARYQAVRALADELSDEYARRFLGRTLAMIAEQKNGPFVSGYSQHYVPARLQATNVKLGSLVDVRVSRVERGSILCQKP